MKKTEFIITGKKPESGEMSRLTSLPFEKRPPGGVEVKDALKWFAIATIFSIFTFFFGKWVIRNFRGPGVLFFGFGGAYIGAPVMAGMAISYLWRLVRSPRKKTPEKAFQWAWLISMLGDDAAGDRFGNTSYAVSTMRRMLPEGTDFSEEAYEKYVTEFRNRLTKVANEHAHEWRSKGFKESNVTRDVEIKETLECAPDLREVKGIVTLRDELVKNLGNNKTQRVFSSILELHISQFYVHSGKYWYPYDLMPKMERGETTDTESSRKE